jgi:hypothetical protein
MIARLLNLCGLYLGPESDLLPAAPDNPEGYWEHRDFVKIDEALLAAFSGAWDLPPALPEKWEEQALAGPVGAQAAGFIAGFSRCERWGWKDPRASLIMPFWRRLLPDLRVIVCVRNPLSVARSLSRRGYNSKAFSFGLWQTYNSRLLADTSPEQRIITHYDSFFRSPETELARILNLLGWPVSEQTIKEACATISPSLVHSWNGAADLEREGVPKGLSELYDKLCEEAGPVYRSLSSIPATGATTANNPEDQKAARGSDGPAATAELLTWRAEKYEHLVEELLVEREHLERALAEQGRWARELENALREQQAIMDAYRRRLGPLVPLARAVITKIARSK